MVARTIGRTAEGHEIKFGTTADMAALTTVIDATVQFWRDDGAKFRSTGAGGWIQTHAAGGAAHVTNSIIGQPRNRIVSVTGDTAPILATSGVASWTAPGVKGIVITGIRVVTGTVPLTANVNWRVRYAVGSPSDAVALAWLPLTTNTANATADIGPVGGFDITPTIVSAVLDANRVVQLILPAPVEIDVSSPVLRLDLVHNITGVVLEFVIQAVEVVQ